MYNDFGKLLEEHTKNPELKKEYETLETKFNIHQTAIETMKAIDDVNNERNLSKTFHSIAELMKDLNH